MANGRSLNSLAAGDGASARVAQEIDRRHRHAEQDRLLHHYILLVRCTVRDDSYRSSDPTIVGWRGSIVCELFAMSSFLPTDVNFSLEEFARHGGRTGPHHDGWGIAYYDDGDVRLVKEVEAAADSEWVRFIEEHGLCSTLVLSHIRKATHGVPALKNTQPFCRELGGLMHVFAHNGSLPASRTQGL